MPSNPFTDPNWAHKTVEIIDRWVGFIRDKTTRPLVNIVRGLVFGIIVMVAAFVMIVLVLIGLARGIQELLDVWLTRSTAVWLSYFILAFIFTALGALIMRRRHSSNN